MSWIEQCAKLLAGGRHDRCEALHAREHRTMRLDLQMGLKLVVFDWRRYEGTHGYCPGDDDVSKCIDVNGIWAPDATALVNDLVTTHDVVLDFGAHLGWFSVVAAKRGATVLAVDADEEHLRLLRANCALNNRHYYVHPVRGWVDHETPDLPVPDARVRLVKIDLEGNEEHAVRAIEPLLIAGQVDHLLMEVSPVFNSSYNALLSRTMQRGYDCHVIDRGKLTPLVEAQLPTFLGACPQFDVLMSRQR